MRVEVEASEAAKEMKNEITMATEERELEGVRWSSFITVDFYVFVCVGPRVCVRPHVRVCEAACLCVRPRVCAPAGVYIYTSTSDDLLLKGGPWRSRSWRPLTL